MKPASASFGAILGSKVQKVKRLSHDDKLKAIEAIATGNLDILPDHLADSVRENVFCIKEATA